MGDPKLVFVWRNLDKNTVQYSTFFNHCREQVPLHLAPDINALDAVFIISTSKKYLSWLTNEITEGKMTVNGLWWLAKRNETDRKTKKSGITLFDQRY